MQKPRFSETQYSFQYTYEHYNKYPFSPFPFFPDTVNEGRYYGFDICIGSIFYQFKVCGLFEACDVKGAKTQQIWNAFGRSCYFTKINFSGKQFMMLSRIASIPRYRDTVMYVMPEFHTRRDIQNLYLDRNIIDRSAHFPVKNFPTDIVGKHTITYMPASDRAMLFSEPIEIRTEKNVQNPERFLKNHPESLFNTAKKIAVMFNDKFNLDISENRVYSYESRFVMAVQTHLLNEYSIHWFPIINPKLLVG